MRDGHGRLVVKRAKRGRRRMRGILTDLQAQDAAAELLQGLPLLHLQLTPLLMEVRATYHRHPCTEAAAFTHPLPLLR